MSRMFKDPMPPLRRRMIEDMVLAGLARRTQLNYLYAVRRCGFRSDPAIHSDLIPATRSDRIPATHSNPVPATYSDRFPATPWGCIG